MSQISQGGLPYSFGSNEFRTPVELVELDKPDVSSEILEDIDRDSFKYPPRDAVILSVEKGLNNAGTWTVLNNGDRVWQLEIKVADAFALELFYEDFYLPEGAKLYLYNHDHSQVLGAFTSINNKPRNKFATDAILGESTILEYYEPAAVAGQGSLTITDLGYSYRNLRSGGGSQFCEVDVACSEGEEWQNEINATMRIRTRIAGNLFWCTGVLMNNTNQDCKPYVLSALHCALNGSSSSSAADFDLYKFYFKFQTPGCDSGNASAASVITGCDKRADSNDDGGSEGSDFMLLELQEQIPESYNPYWAGWTSSSSAVSGGGVCIHHPNADVKKISTFSSTPQTASWQPPSSSNNHWRVFWIETDNGWGVTEGGSSGSAIFNSNHHVMGTLTGGQSFCDTPTLPDLFGKMQRHFVSNPNPTSQKLKAWLDPADLDVVTLDGSSDPCGNVSVEEINSKNIFSLFPNPGSGDFTIELINEDIKISTLRIFDAYGKLVKEFNPLMYPISVNLEDEADGIYTVQIITEDNLSISNKLILQR